MLKLLIDTSVWLDLAKDYRNLPLLTLLGETCSSRTIFFIDQRCT